MLAAGPDLKQRGRRRLAPVVIGGVGTADAAALLLPGGWSTGVPCALVGASWLTLVVCFPLARRHPGARDLGVAAAVAMLVTLAYLPVRSVLELVLAR